MHVECPSSIDAERVVRRCEKCGLNQYLTSNDLCRRCKAPMWPKVTPEEIAAAAPEFKAPGSDQPRSYELLIAGRLRMLRCHAGLSQRKLATISGILRTNLVRLESGTVVPHMSTLLRLCQALQVPMDALICHDDVVAEAARLVHNIAEKDRQCILEWCAVHAGLEGE